MILAVFVICFLYVSYDTAPKLMVNMFFVCFRFSLFFFFVFLEFFRFNFVFVFLEGVCLMVSCVNVENESIFCV